MCFGAEVRSSEVGWLEQEEDGRNVGVEGVGSDGQSIIS